MCWPPQLHPILVVNRLQEVTCSTLVWAIFKEYNDYKIECSNCQPVDGDVEGAGISEAKEKVGSVDRWLEGMWAMIWKGRASKI